MTVHGDFRVFKGTWYMHQLSLSLSTNKPDKKMNSCFRKQAAARYVSFEFFFVLENKLDKKMNNCCRKQAAATDLFFSFFFSFLLEKTW
jgi:hypothetical protein